MRGLAGRAGATTADRPQHGQTRDRGEHASPYDGKQAYAHPPFRGEARYDDLAVLGAAGETWYARIVGLARFAFPPGGPAPIDGVLVRWFERAPPAVVAGVATSVRDALAPCPLVYPDALGWICPDQALRRVGVVPCWYLDAGAGGVPAAAPVAGARQYVFINEFYHRIAATSDGLDVQVAPEDE